MKFAVCVTVLLGSVCAVALAQHVNLYLTGCDKTETEDATELDGDEMFYMDFNQNKVFMTLPDFAEQFTSPGWEQQALAERATCRNNLDVAIKAENNPPEEIDPPVNTVYPRDDVEVGKPNTLICFVNNFYPPPIKVKWTRNDKEVKEGVTLGRYFPNSDFTFRQFSMLSFTPQEGDVYSCTVEHQGLTEPMTRIWEPEIKTESDIGPTAFCGVGLTLGLLGVAAGTFFLIKGNNCN